MSQLGPPLRFAAQLYRQRAGVGYRGHVRRDPMARLELRPGRDDPYAIYDQIRARGTLTRIGPGNWVTPSYRVCDAVLRDRRFGVNPDTITRAGAADAADTVVPAGEEFDLSFLGMDPPDHSRLRRIAQPAFSPRAVATYRGRIERTVGDLLDRVLAGPADGQGSGGSGHRGSGPGDEFDLVSAFAAPLPIAVITDLLGIPDADAQPFAQYGMVIGSALDGIRSLRHAAALQASDVALTRLFENLFELRRREPADDVVSRLVAAPAEQVRPGEMVPMCTLLLVAGFETTVNLIGNGVLALLRHPEQWQALCDDPAALAAAAVEETLRFDSPVQRTGRIALEPLQLAGERIRRGELVVTLIGAANRDPQVYDRPGSFDIRRDGPADHLAFSSGIHYCLGQSLARLEATVALRMLAERMPGLSLAGPVRRRNATTIRGPLRLPVRARADRRPGRAKGRPAVSAR